MYKGVRYTQFNFLERFDVYYNNEQHLVELFVKHIYKLILLLIYTL